MKILHVITGLNDGGAEAQLYHLIMSDRESGNTHIVISLTSMGKYGSRLESGGVNVFALNMKSMLSVFTGLTKLGRLINLITPDVLQTWMYHSDFLAGLVGKLSGVKRIFWGVHHSDLSRKGNKLSTLIIARICSYLSSILPTKIVYCARTAKYQHEEFGYCKRKSVVIPNGYNHDFFKFDERARCEKRSQLNFSNSDFVIGHVGRFHPLKDYKTFVKAASIFMSEDSDCKVLLIGTGLTSSNSELMKMIEQYGLADRFVLVGPKDEIPSFLSAIDIFLLSSLSEAFPNVLNEAMLCNVPCVSTDVGDASLIVSRFGWISDSNNPECISSLVLKAKEESISNSEAWAFRKENCRKHIVSNFSQDRVRSAYINLWTYGEMK